MICFRIDQTVTLCECISLTITAVPMLLFIYILSQIFSKCMGENNGHCNVNVFYIMILKYCLLLVAPKVIKGKKKNQNPNKMLNFSFKTCVTSS